MLSESSTEFLLHKVGFNYSTIPENMHTLIVKGWGFQMPKFLKDGVKLTGISRVEVGVSNQKTFHWWRKGVWIFSGRTHW